MRTLLSLGVVLLFAPGVAAASALEVRVAERELLVSGARPGATVLVIGVTREPRGFHSLLRTHALPAVVSDARGDAKIAYGAEVPAKSLWIAVDVQTGLTGAGAPGDFPVRQFEIDPGAVAPDRVVLARTVLDMLVVRPGAGAWLLSAYEGGRGDGDRAVDGKLSVLASELAPAVGKERLSGGLRPGDVVIALDPDQMEYGIVRVSGSGGKR